MALPAVPNKNVQIRQYLIADNEDWVEGALLLLSDGELSEAGANPTPVVGFAAHDVPMQPADVYDGYAQVFCAYPGSTFWLSGTTAPLAAHEGNEYGVNYEDGVARVNIADTTNVRVLVERVDPVRGLFEVSIIADHRVLQAVETT